MSAIAAADSGAGLFARTLKWIADSGAGLFARSEADSEGAGEGAPERPAAGIGEGAVVSAPPRPPKHLTRVPPAEELRPEPPPPAPGEEPRGAK